MTRSTRAPAQTSQLEATGATGATRTGAGSSALPPLNGPVRALSPVALGGDFRPGTGERLQGCQRGAQGFRGRGGAAPDE